jgi:hypothetical protein
VSESEQPQSTTAVTVTNTTEVMPRLPTLESVRRSAHQESGAAILLVTFRDAGPGEDQRCERGGLSRRRARQQWHAVSGSYSSIGSAGPRR